MSKSNVGFDSRAVSSSANTTKSIIIPGRSGVQAICKSLDATGGNAATTVYAFAARHGLKTVVSAATNDGATAITVDADDNGYINGYQIADNDYLLVNTNAGSADDASGKYHSWRLLLISAASEDAANDECDLTVSGLDGHTGIEGTVTAGATAYIIRAAHSVAYTVGAASIAKVNVVAGEPEAPIGFYIVPVDATAHDMAVFVEFV